MLLLYRVIGEGIASSRLDLTPVPSPTRRGELEPEAETHGLGRVWSPLSLKGEGAAEPDLLNRPVSPIIHACVLWPP
jgi:hypothetical protein